MQNQITADVAESRAKKLSGRLLTIKLAVERFNYNKEQEKPSCMKVRMSKLREIEDLKFTSNLIKNPWE
jgi:hypothetical protein